MGFARHVAGIDAITLPGLGSGCRQVAIGHHLMTDANRKLARLDRDTHRLLAADEMRVDVVRLGADRHQLAGLVGRYQQRDAEVVQQFTEGVGVAAGELMAHGLQDCRTRQR